MPPLSSLPPSVPHPQFIPRNSETVPGKQWSCRWPAWRLANTYPVVRRMEKGCSVSSSIFTIHKMEIPANLLLIDTGTPFGNFFSSFNPVILVSYSPSSFLWCIKHHYPPYSSWLPSTRWWCAAEKKESWKFKVWELITELASHLGCVEKSLSESSPELPSFRVSKNHFLFSIIGYFVWFLLPCGFVFYGLGTELAFRILSVSSEIAFLNFL